jgi:hypothetical protein
MDASMNNSMYKGAGGHIILLSQNGEVRMVCHQARSSITELEIS